MEPHQQIVKRHREDRLGSRWQFLENESDPCSVVTRHMEVLYLNAAARSLVPLCWFGCRCWEIFPVGAESCAAHCPAVRAVSSGEEIVYCEETVYSRSDGSPVHVGVAVIPVNQAGGDEEKALLLLRPKATGCRQEEFQRDLLERAQALRERCA